MAVSRFQSPDGDSVVSHPTPTAAKPAPAPAKFQSPDGDSVVSHALARLAEHLGRRKFQSPDGDSVVSHVLWTWITSRSECYTVSVP